MWNLEVPSPSGATLHLPYTTLTPYISPNKDHRNIGVISLKYLISLYSITYNYLIK